MQRDNTLDVGEYIGTYLFWGFVSYLWYNKIYFKRIGVLTYNQSKWCLIALLVVVCVIGIVVTYKKHCNYRSVILNFILAYGLYTFAAYSGIFPGRIKLSLIISLSLTMVWILILFCRKIHNQSKRRKIIKGRIIRALFALRNGVCIAVVIVMLPIGAKFLFNGTISSSSVPATRVYGDEYTISSNIEVLANIVQEKWELLSARERLDVCQVIANIEGNYLGIANQLYVEMANLTENTCGYYEDERQMIVIDIDHLMNSSASNVVETICHEAYHSYQSRLVDLYNSLDEESNKLLLFYDASIYRYEFENYESGDNDFVEYYSQKVEYDARRYSKSTVEEYYKKVNEYLKAEDSGIEY